MRDRKRAPRPGLRQFGMSAITALLLAGPWAPAHSEDLGRYGNLWEIEEQDGVEQFIDKLKRMERDGSLRELQERYRDDFVERLESPDPIPGISPAFESVTYHVDPSIVVSEPIQDETGRIVVPAGVRINPLDHTKWTKAIVLIDARYPEQIEFAKARIEQFPDDKVILVGGSYLKLMRTWERRVYYDLGGAFTARFGLTKVPAIISQDGQALLVQEFAVTEFPSIFEGAK